MSDEITKIWTQEERARHREARERFQREQPTLKQQLASGEYDGPMPLGEYLSHRTDQKKPTTD